MLIHAEVAVQSGRGCYISQRKFEDSLTGQLPADCRKTLAGRRAVLLARWIVRSVPLEIVWSSGQEGTYARKTGSGATRNIERGSKDRAASTNGYNEA
ncbi:hypothetical protein TNCV_4579671 [Trichonephila clavipes]|nr:hypothetical protein TNCV_4579671 [Trichonephila clavipes]